MNRMIDLNPYLPAAPVRKAPRAAAALLIWLEAVISIGIGVTVLIGIAAFLLML